MNADPYFLGILVYTILQRTSEVLIARRNTKKLIAKGAIEFGGSHYSLMVAMHAAFFVSMLVEYFFTDPTEAHTLLLIFFAISQAIRFWIMRVLGERWTTRVLVIKAEKLVSRGPYRYLAHPNYLVVAIEILVLPLAFGLWRTAIVFSLLNAIMLLAIRIPAEREALDWSQDRTTGSILNPN